MPAKLGKYKQNTLFKHYYFLMFCKDYSYST